MSAAPTPTLSCKECGYQNEPERVYCHNCGAKLDRSVLPKEEQLRRETPDKARRRIMRMTNPGSGQIKKFVVSLVKTLLYAAVVAGLVLGARAPADAPAAKGELGTRLIPSELSALMSSPQPRSTTFSQADLNSFLNSLHVKKESSVPGASFKRAFVNLDPGVGRFSIERGLWDYPIYFGTLYRVEANSGVFTAINVGGNFGRLPIHPVVMKYLEPLLFRDVYEALKPQTDLLRKAYFLRVEKGRLALASGAAKP